MVRPVPQGAEQLPFRLNGLADISPQGMGPAGLIIAAFQHLVPAFQEDDLVGYLQGSQLVQGRHHVVAEDALPAVDDHRHLFHRRVGPLTQQGKAP